jgi:essential nuclear protein 1
MILDLQLESALYHPAITMPRIGKLPGKSRHDPLLVQLDEDEEARYGRISQPGKRKKAKINRENDEDDNAEVLSLTKTYLTRH